MPKTSILLRIVFVVVLLGVLAAFLGPRLYLLSQWESVPLAFVDASIQIDGKLDEACWNLQKQPFCLVDQEGTESDNVPQFQFHQDSKNLYFAARYEFPTPVDLNNIEAGSLSLQLKLRPRKEGSHYKFRVLMEPNDREGGLTGCMWCDCPKYVRYWDKEIDNCSQVARIDNTGWTIELAIPLAEVIHPDDNRLAYELGFYSDLGGKETRATYPFPYDDPYKRRFFKVKQTL